MPELPEVEVLVQHLDSTLRGKIVRNPLILSPRFVSPTPEKQFREVIEGSRIQNVRRRGKFIIFCLQRTAANRSTELIAHLGMTGRIFLQEFERPLPVHTRLRIDLSPHHQALVFQDPRGFGGCSLNSPGLLKLGPEPWDPTLTPTSLSSRLQSSRQPIKVKLLDQSIIAGIGNIYASEILHAACLSPLRSSRSLALAEYEALLHATRDVLSKSVQLGLSLDLDFGATSKNDGLFYYGSSGSKSSAMKQERFAVYDREGHPCPRCHKPIHRLHQAGRSTFFCKKCQH